ncbi:MAG: IPT/TIG domain-containing protein [Cyanobacteria bacterium REEB65]|nr:IPT/TIG domain-containing protein [Cyanobacteria bacterium REEB65]
MRIPSGASTALFPVAALAGRVDFMPRYQVQATPKDVAQAATVSLIDPNTDTTMATTLTDASGSFTLQISGFGPLQQTYYLEAVKGLDNNVAGHDAVRLRTLVAFNGHGWSALSTNDASIGIATTAISALVDLRRNTTNPLQPGPLIGTLTPDSTASYGYDFASAGTNETPAELLATENDVSSALLRDFDPLTFLQYGSNGPTLTLPVDGLISQISPDPAPQGGTVTVKGQGFDPSPSNNTITLDSLTLAAATASSTSLTFTLPPTATSGLLTVDGATASLIVLPTVSGNLFGGGSGVPPVGTGTSIPGGFF